MRSPQEFLGEECQLAVQFSFVSALVHYVSGRPLLRLNSACVAAMQGDPVASGFLADIEHLVGVTA